MLRHITIYVIIAAVFSLWTPLAHGIIIKSQYAGQSEWVENAIKPGDNARAHEIKQTLSLFITGEQPRTGAGNISKTLGRAQLAAGNPINVYKAGSQTSRNTYHISSRGCQPHPFACGRSVDYYILALRRIII